MSIPLYLVNKAFQCYSIATKLLRTYAEEGELTMNKTELVTKIAEDAGLSKKDAGAALDAAITAVTDTLAAGDSVIIPGFLSASVKDKPAREGRYPATGEKIKIAAARVPVLKAGKGLKDAVAKK